VRLAGFEPTTLCLEGRCSIQLSYRRDLPDIKHPGPVAQAGGSPEGGDNFGDGFGAIHNTPRYAGYPNQTRLAAQSTWRSHQ
jgi:hypothetical protein